MQQEQIKKSATITGKPVPRDRLAILSPLINKF